MNDPVLGTIVGHLVRARDAATTNAAAIRERQKAKGYALDTRADYAEGAAGAYAFALSIVAGAAGVADPMVLVDTAEPIAHNPLEPLSRVQPLGENERV